MADHLQIWADIKTQSRATGPLADEARRVLSLSQDNEILEKRVEMFREALDVAASALGLKLEENEDGVMHFKRDRSLTPALHKTDYFRSEWDLPDVEQIVSVFNDALDA